MKNRSFPLLLAQALSGNVTPLPKMSKNVDFLRVSSYFARDGNLALFQIVPPDFVHLGAQLGALRPEKAWCPQMSLKAAEIRGFQPIDTVYRKSDDKGLYLEIRPNGSKHWFVKYRIHGSEKRLSLGSWPEVLLADARERRDDVHKKIRAGDDPLHSRKMEKIRARLSADNSFQSVAEDLIAVRFVASQKAEATIEKAR